MKKTSQSNCSKTVIRRKSYKKPEKNCVLCIEEQRLRFTEDSLADSNHRRLFSDQKWN